MKRMIFVLLLLIFSHAFAGEKEANGTVQLFAYHELGRVVVVLSGSNVNCGNKYWLDPTDDMGKTLLSMLLAAQMAGKRVWVNGAGECLTGYPYNNAYRLVHMQIKNS